MKRTRSLLGSAGAAVAPAAPSATAVAENDEIRRAVPIGFASTPTAIWDTLPWVAERIAEVSGGKISLRSWSPVR